MKKKLLLLSTVTTLAFALCGCDSKDSKDDVKEPTTTEAAIEITTEANIEITSEDNIETTTEAQDISEQTEDAERGVVENGVYTNNAFKLSFPVQDDWYVCSDDEVAEIIGFTVDTLDENSSMTVEQFEAATSGTVYDLVFYFSDMQSNANITLTSLDRLGTYGTLPTESYAELSMTQLGAMTTPEYSFDEITVETYGGDEYVCINAETDQGYNQKMLMKKENGYMIIITLTYLPELTGEMQSLLDSFIDVD